MNDNNGRSSIETETTMSYNTNQLLAQHDQILQEQDRGLETLSHIVQNQKRIATAIGNEVDKQNGKYFSQSIRQTHFYIFCVK